MLESPSPASANVTGIGIIFRDRSILTSFNKPGVPPYGDSRTPDIIVTANVGVTYSGGTKKQAEHGGFAHDDTNVMILVSHPDLCSKTITSPVETMQIARAILNALGLDGNPLAIARRGKARRSPGAGGLPF